MVLLAPVNVWLFSSVHAFVGLWWWLDDGAIFLADYIQYVIAFAVIVLWVRYPKHRVMVVVSMSASLVARLVVKPLILLFYAEPRPFVYLHFTPLVSTYVSENFQSFPSGHALFFFALATVVYLFHKKYGRWFLVAALLMGLSRIYIGVHWPFDILVGAVLGMGVGFGVYYAYHRYRLQTEHFVCRFL
jgi:undecaprenyl-diphosphatase